jgi:hypothetical protein
MLRLRVSTFVCGDRALVTLEVELVQERATSYRSQAYDARVMSAK